jgi:hypothetical protein
MPKKTIFYALFALMMGTACANFGGLPDVTPTAKPIVINYPTAAPTHTIDATASAQPSPTLRPTQTSAPTGTPFEINSVLPTAETINGIKFGPEQIVPGGKFAFKRPYLGGVEMEGNQVFLTLADGNAFMILWVEPTEYNTPSAYLDYLFDELGGGLSGTPRSYILDGRNGLISDIGEVSGDTPYEGQVVVVFLEDGEVFVGLGLGSVFNGINYWQTDGLPLFETILSTVRFLSGENGGGGGSGLTCTVSTDGTYGYSMDNPVQVGGGAFGGPLRERLYFDTLRGPSGQILSYTRQGSQAYGEVILDIFQVSYAGLEEPVLIYVDEDAFSDLFAPVGFTCSGNFPMSAP